MINEYYADRLARLGCGSLVERYRGMLPSQAKALLEQELRKASKEYQDLGLKALQFANARIKSKEAGKYSKMFLSNQESSRQRELRDLIQCLEACQKQQP